MNVEAQSIGIPVAIQIYFLELYLGDNTHSHIVREFYKDFNPPASVYLELRVLPKNVLNLAVRIYTVFQNPRPLDVIVNFFLICKRDKKTFSYFTRNLNRLFYHGETGGQI